MVDRGGEGAGSAEGRWVFMIVISLCLMGWGIGDGWMVAWVDE